MIDLSSDTATKPTPEMRRFMADAPVGDDQRGEDPTVNQLQDEVANLLGMEWAWFLPSATMANQIAIKIQTQAGDEVFCHEHAHIRLYEGGSPAALSGVQLSPLVGVDGKFTGDQVRQSLHGDDPHYAVPRLVCIENTHNYAGGTVWTRAELDTVADAAEECSLALHLDGSRLMNAAAMLNLPAAELTRRFDTVTLCLSKGLGAPVGAILAGRDATKAALARHWKHRLGGAMRQAGIIAAGGLFGIRHNLSRLPDDHLHARLLADALAEIRGIRLDPSPHTNIVYFDVTGTGRSGAEMRTRLESAGVRASQPAPNRLRFVTHLDVSHSDIDDAIGRIRSALSDRNR